MSGLCMYEFEDIVWDELYQSGDHIVPHPLEKQTKKISFQGDSCKKPHREVTGISGSYEDNLTARLVGQEKEQGEISTLTNRRKSMLEKDSWSRTPNSVFPSSSVCDSIKEASTLASENTIISSNGFKNNNNMESLENEFGANDPALSDKCTAVDGSSFSYPLGDISQTDSDLNFFDSNPEDEDSSYFLCHGWPEIGNFEDVDMMFRSCDSTYGLGTGNESELGWFSSDDAIGGSGDVLKLDCKFLCPSKAMPMENISENHEPSKGIGLNGRIHAKISTNNHYKTGGSGMINDHKEQLNQQNQCVRKRKGKDPTNDTFNYISNLPNEVRLLPSGATSHEAFQSMAQHQQRARGSVSSDYLRGAFPCVQSDTCHLSDQTSVASIVGSKNGENLRHHQGGGRSPTVDPFAVEKGDKSENPSDDYDVSTVIAAELWLSNVQESSSVSSTLDDISLEAASFRQLQVVMEQLDSRTKLCIRDSLYRLARNAEERHNHANLNGGSRDERDVSVAFTAEGSDQCTGFMDIETNTNPVDRSIAHLLFHRPSDSSSMPANDALAFRSPSRFHGPITSPPLISNKVMNREENAAEVEKSR